MSDILDATLNGVKIGEFYREADGYYVFDPLADLGSLNERALVVVLLSLRTLNSAWDVQCQTDPKISGGETCLG